MKQQSKIKLFKLGTMEDGTVRLQSQLPFWAGNNVADFIFQDGKLKHFKRGKSGYDFYETDIPYQIVTKKSEMNSQIL